MIKGMIGPKQVQNLARKIPLAVKAQELSFLI